MENENVIRSSYDRAYVSKKLDEKKTDDVVDEKPKTTRKKTTTKKTTSTTNASTTTSKPKKEDPKPSQVAVHSDGKLSHPALGRLTKGYNVVTPEQAEEWIKVSNKVRMATPEEVASAFEV